WRVRATREGPRLGAAAAVGRRERLVQVELQDVDAHVARLGDTEERVHVRAVHVEETAPGMDRGRDGFDLLLEEAERVRVGDHERGYVVVHQGGDGARLEDAARAYRHLADLVATERRACGIGPVRARRDQHAAADVAAVAVVRTYEEHAEQLSLRAGGGLERHGVEAGHGHQRALERLAQGE